MNRDQDFRNLYDRYLELEREVRNASTLGRDLARNLAGVRRNVARLERDLAHLVELVDTMTRAEEFEKAMQSALRAERGAILTVPRKIAGLVLGLLVAVPALHELTLWIR